MMQDRLAMTFLIFCGGEFLWAVRSKGGETPPLQKHDAVY